MRSGIEFSIVSDTKFALSVDPNHRSEGSQLVLEEVDSTSELQRWTCLYDPATQGAILLNQNVNMFAAPDDQGKVVLRAYAAGQNYKG